MSYENNSEQYTGPDQCGLCNGWGFSRQVDDYDHKTGEWKQMTILACPRCDGTGRDGGNGDGRPGRFGRDNG